MDFKARRRMLLNSLAKKGQIIISNANADNPVIVTNANGVTTTYTKPITIPIVSGTETIEMSVGYLKTFTWTVDGVAKKHSADSTDSYKAYFTAFEGHTYTIDAINKIIEVQKPDNWDGFIYDSDDTRPHYPYAPLSSGAWIRFVQSSERRLKTTSSSLIFGPIDVTGFKSITISGSSMNTSGSSSSRGYRCTIKTDALGESTSGTTFEYDNDPDVDADPYINTLVFKSGTTKITSLNMRNLYSNQVAIIYKIKLNK